MSAADDALRWAHDTYATYNLTDGEAAATGAALAQAEQLARIADALEGILATLRPEAPAGADVEAAFGVYSAPRPLSTLGRIEPGEENPALPPLPPKDGER